MESSADWRAVAAPRARPALPRRFVVGGLILLLAIGYLVLTGLGAGTAYYLTVTELKTQGVAPGQVVRVSGEVKPGSIVRAGSAVRFDIADSGGSLPVVYRGVVPDIFSENIQVVVEGRPDATGTFQAKTLLAKCPSKFEAAPGPGGRA